MREKHLLLAAKFHVLSMLHFHGAEATLLSSQPDGGADIVVFNRRGEALTIDVKTVTKESIWCVNPLAARKNHFVVLVDYSCIDQQPDRGPDVYVIPSEILRDFVARRDIGWIAIDDLNAELHIRNAWHSVIADAA